MSHLLQLTPRLKLRQWNSEGPPTSVEVLLLRAQTQPIEALVLSAAKKQVEFPEAAHLRSWRDK